MVGPVSAKSNWVPAAWSPRRLGQHFGIFADQIAVDHRMRATGALAGREDEGGLGQALDLGLFNRTRRASRARP
jgi:hypothetical protein